MNYKVIQVIPTKDFKVYIYFIDGKVKLFDATRCLDIDPIILYNECPEVEEPDIAIL